MTVEMQTLKPVRGGWRILNGPDYRPSRWTRFWVWFLLGWTWTDL